VKRSATLALLFLAGAAMGQSSIAAEPPSAAPMTLAVFGDWPYKRVLLDSASLLIDSINADPQVELVLHLGDIHAGSQPCTGAGLVPAPLTADPLWNERILALFQRINAPLVYTPGDNEWTDCHAPKAGSSGDPLQELGAVRRLFFARPGQSLGAHPRRLLSQAQAFDPTHPGDAQFVENARWEASRIMFVTVNLPGSDNDTVPWSGSFANPAAQAAEVAGRTSADLRWLAGAFRLAKQHGDAAVVIATQADMLNTRPDPAEGDRLDAYQPIVRALADMAVEFGRPVLLLNGDSHHFVADRPLADPDSPTGRIHHVRPVPNLQRIAVQGSTSAPAEWLRLTIDPTRSDLFTWRNVVYCADPKVRCP
jgi:hypothetical protein